VNYGTESKYDNSAQWRIPNGLSSLWAILLGTAILFLPESPRYSYRAGRKEEARKVLAQLSGEDPYGPEMDAEINEIERKLQADNNSGSYHWHEIFTAPRMLYRTLLGCMLQAGQQMTGNSFTTPQYIKPN
jgi:SP family sugar:H+ symporter-like MFS transporter